MPSVSAPVCLVMATGSRAGTEAPIMLGYYMIGRDSECQIRPKSKSVSRRHCLIHHEDGVVKVFDLDSTAGTFVNEERLEERSWAVLRDGDVLRVGKIQFHVQFNEPELENHSPQSVQTRADEISDEVTGDTSTASQNAASQNATSQNAVANPSEGTVQPPAGQQTDPDADQEMEVIQGDAWESFDVAGFLEDEDATAQERRYADIKGQDPNRTIFGAGAGDGAGDGATGSGEDVGDQSDEGPPIAKPKKKREPEKTFAPKRKAKSGKGFSFSMPNFGNLGGDGDSASQLKLAAVVILALTTLGFAGFQLMKSTSGPPIRVLDELDR